MIANKIYEPADRMALLIDDCPDVLEMLGRFGIPLGFGEKTVAELCKAQDVDCYTFLCVVNYILNNVGDVDVSRLDVATLMRYLRASHTYYLQFLLPFIREQLVACLDKEKTLSRLILRLYEDYVHEVTTHMQLEEDEVFPYVDSLLAGKHDGQNSIDTFMSAHNSADSTLRELKNIMTRYLPTDVRTGNHLAHTLYSLYCNETWLRNHAKVEDALLTPAIRLMEHRVRHSDVSRRLSQLIAHGDAGELSARERDIVVGVVQGMSNKEIAEHLFISLNTVVTHRRNIARKLHIHSPAGLTIYAIVNNLVDISEICT
ncbi:MAG: LuxR C-terminal-related transcriptional regulator [Paraprevotella sp.]|nr:LuxR C-terminal-related transcriptional regulator [Paraprevotella sp.]